MSDVLPLLAAADVFAVPSRREGQGIAALEAMAAGLPVVASRIGGLADMLTDGETALLVPPDDPDALAAALSRLKSDARLRKKLAENAAPLVQARYDVQQMLASVTEAVCRSSPEQIRYNSAIRRPPMTHLAANCPGNRRLAAGARPAAAACPGADF